MAYNRIKFDVADLLSVFDELLPMSDEERGIYWFKSTRSDGISITLSFSAYELSANIIVRCDANVSCSSIEVKDCTLVRVLEPERNCLEIVGGDITSPKMRCLLCITSDNILEVTIP